MLSPEARRKRPPAAKATAARTHLPDTSGRPARGRGRKDHDDQPRRVVRIEPWRTGRCQGRRPNAGRLGGLRRITAYASRTQSHSSGLVSRGSIISSIPNYSAVRVGLRTASSLARISVSSTAMRSLTISRPASRCRLIFSGPPMRSASSWRRRSSSSSGCHVMPLKANRPDRSRLDLDRRLVWGVSGGPARWSCPESRKSSASSRAKTAPERGIAIRRWSTRASGGQESATCGHFLALGVNWWCA